jgi:RHS repeat-associated protein
VHAVPAGVAAAPAQTHPALALPPLPSLPVPGHAPAPHPGPGARPLLPMALHRAGVTPSGAIQFQRGWNLISLPVAPTSPLSAAGFLTDVVAATHGHLAALYALVNNGWSAPVLDIAGHLSPTDFPLQVGTGYLLYSDAQGSVTLSGAVPPPPAWLVAPGWNLVGTPQGATGAISATTVLASLLTATHGHLAALYALVNNGWSAPVLDIAGHLSPTDFPLQAGTAYLLYSDARAAAFAVPGFLPPDPGTVAPPVDPTLPTTVLSATSFLYSGPNPIQTGVASGTIELTRTAVLRGAVTDDQGIPLSGVTVSIADHPEYGQTLSRADGMFDLAVNGGGSLTIVYNKSSYLPALRQAQVPEQDFTTVPGVALVQQDPTVTAINLASSAAVQVARGGTITDGDGTRQQTLLFFPGTTATMALPDGSTRPITPTLHVRMTEYTVGPNGPQAMPAQLPPTSGYTYATLLGIDEATAAGATGVQFSKPVISYMENFLGLPVGMDVPFGAYGQASGNPSTGQWVPQQDGQVVQILSTTGGQAILDVDGKGQAATGAELSALGISTAELRELAALYQQGQSLWRFALRMAPAGHAGAQTRHGSASGADEPSNLGSWDVSWERLFDFNMGVGPGFGASAPALPRPSIGSSLQNATDPPGFQVENQAVSEDLPIAGTPFHLHYTGLRAQGNRAAQTLVIPLSGATLPPNVQRIELEVDVAGRQFTQVFPPNPNQTYSFTWDGKDAYGQTLQGPQPATVRVGYAYPTFYLYPSCNPLTVNPRYDATFGHFSYYGETATVNPARTAIILWQSWQLTIGAFHANGEDLGGWSLDVHHTYDPSSRILYLGDGGQQGGTQGDITAAPIVSTVAGNGSVCDGTACGDGGSAGQAALANPAGIAAAPDGTLYIADQFDNRVRRVSADGTINTAAGTGRPCLPTATCGDGGPATQAQLNSPDAVAVGPDGSLYIADAGNQRIRRVTPDGVISTVAGTGTICASPTGGCGDGYPATQAQLNDPQGIAVGPDGSLYIADSGDLRVRLVSPDGVISTLAGTGQPCAPATAACGDGGAAEQATLVQPSAVALDRDGNLYIADFGAARVRRVTPGGAISTFAGTGVPCTIGTSCGDGDPATQATLFGPRGLAVGSDGGVYIADAGANRVRLVQSDGTISTVAGTSQPCAAASAGCGDGGIATQAQLNNPVGVVVAPAGSAHTRPPACYGGSGQPVGQPESGPCDSTPDAGIDVVDQADGRVRLIASPLPGLGLTAPSIPSQDGSQIYLFDPSGRQLATLDALTAAVLYRFGYDGAGRLTTITDRAGNTTTIQRDGNGNPVAIVGPFGQTTTLTLDANGYLAQVADPLHQATGMTYTSDGLLTSLTDPRGHTYHFGYDGVGRLVQDVRPDGGIYQLTRADTASATLPTDYTVSETSPMSRTGTYQVQQDITGTLRRSNTDPAGHTTTGTLTAGNAWHGAAPDGTVSQGSLGPDPRFGSTAPLPTFTQVTTPTGLAAALVLTRTVAMAGSASVLSMTALTDTITLNGRTSTSVYNAASRTATITSPAGRSGSMTLDSAARLAEVSVPGLAPIQYSYDSRGRVHTISQGTRVYTFSYDPASGYLASVADPLGRVTTFTRDADGRVTGETLPGNRQVGFAYDANGNMTGITPPGRAAHTFAYTALDQAQRYTPPSGAPLSTSYDLDGQPTQTTLPDGSHVTVTYDSAGRPASLTTSGPSGAGTTGYHYDATSGNLSSVTGPDGGTVTLSYDGHLPTGISATGVMPGAVAYSYDPNFRVVADSVDGGNGVSYHYDGDGLLTGANNLSLSYDPHNGLPVSSTLSGVGTSVSHDQFGAVVGYSARYGTSTLLAEQYSRDALGRVIAQTETIGGTAHTFAYSYDAAGHLSGVSEDGHSVAQYAYDANDNRTSVTTPAGSTVSASYDAQDRLSQQGSVSYSYNANGYLQSKTDTSTHKTTSYVYDALGNLTAVTLPDGTHITYLVDGLGRRIEKRVNGAATQGLLYGADALRPIAELDGAGNLVSRFVYVSATGAPAYMVKGGVTYRMLTDNVGSVRLVVNAGTGAVAQQLTYDAFGNVLSDSNPGFQPFGFAGGLYDPRTGLVRFGARDYDPQAGRWTARDPLLFAGGQTNLYVYVGDDPVNWADPSGLGGDGGLWPASQNGVRQPDYIGFSVAAYVGPGGGVSVYLTRHGGIVVSPALGFGLQGKGPIFVSGYIQNGSPDTRTLNDETGFLTGPSVNAQGGVGVGGAGATQASGANAVEGYVGPGAGWSSSAGYGVTPQDIGNFFTSLLQPAPPAPGSYLDLSGGNVR